MPAVMFAPMPEDGTDVDTSARSRADGAMDRYAAGDEAAFVELYDELAPRLYRLALRRIRDRSAAEDVVQQTLLQMHGARHRFVRGAAVLPWAYAIARRLLIDLGRRGVREELRSDDVLDPEEAIAGPSPEEALDGRRAEGEARRDLALLPSSWREAFELLRIDGLSVAETAEVLGITRGMVKIRVHRATAALRVAMTRRLGHAREGVDRLVPCTLPPRDRTKPGVPT